MKGVPGKYYKHGVRWSYRRPDKLIRELEAIIATFEREYGMSTETMKRELYHRRLPETDEVCEWLMAASAKERLMKNG